MKDDTKKRKCRCHTYYIEGEPFLCCEDEEIKPKKKACRKKNNPAK